MSKWGRDVIRTLDEERALGRIKKLAKETIQFEINKQKGTYTGEVIEENGEK